MTQVHSLQDIRQREIDSQLSSPMVRVGFGNLQSFELSQRMAKMLAQSSLVPKEFQGNIANCVIALNMADRMGSDPLMVMQNLYIVHGRPSFSSQFLIACINSCGRFSALQYEFFGKSGSDDWGCRAFATEKMTGEIVYGPTVTYKMAKDEGWHGRNGSKWKTMPELMLTYRAASFFARTKAPEISMGMQTAEEVYDTYDAKQDSSGSFAVRIDDMKPDQEPDTHEATDGNDQTAKEESKVASKATQEDEPAASDLVEKQEAKQSKQSKTKKPDMLGDIE